MLSHFKLCWLMRLLEVVLTVSLFAGLFYFGFELVFLLAFLFVLPFFNPFGRWEFPVPTLTYFLFRHFGRTKCSSCDHSVFNDFADNRYTGNDFRFTPNRY